MRWTRSPAQLLSCWQALMQRTLKVPLFFGLRMADGKEGFIIQGKRQAQELAGLKPKSYTRHTKLHSTVVNHESWQHLNSPIDLHGQPKDECFKKRLNLGFKALMAYQWEDSKAFTRKGNRGNWAMKLATSRWVQVVWSQRGRGRRKKDETQISVDKHDPEQQRYCMSHETIRNIDNLGISKTRFTNPLITQLFTLCYDMHSIWANYIQSLDFYKHILYDQKAIEEEQPPFIQLTNAATGLFVSFTANQMTTTQYQH